MVLKKLYLLSGPNFWLRSGLCCLAPRSPSRRYGHTDGAGWRRLVVVIAVYYVSLLVAGRLGIDRKFAHMLSTSVSICGVSAAIATFGAIKGDKKHLNMTLLLIAVFVIPMFLGMPLVAKAIGMNRNLFFDALKYMKNRTTIRRNL